MKRKKCKMEDCGELFLPKPLIKHTVPTVVDGGIAKEKHIKIGKNQAYARSAVGF